MQAEKKMTRLSDYDAITRTVQTTENGGTGKRKREKAKGKEAATQGLPVTAQHSPPLSTRAAEYQVRETDSGIFRGTHQPRRIC